MNRQKLFRYSDVCLEKCIPEDEEDIYSHEDNSDIKHQYIRHKHFNDHFKNYHTFVKQSIAQLEDYGDSVVQKLAKIKMEVELFEKEFNSKIRQYIQSFECDLFDAEKDKAIVLNFKKNHHDAFTCSEMSRLIRLTDIESISLREKEIKKKMEHKIEGFEQDFEDFFKHAFKFDRIEFISIADKNLLNMLKLNESSIIKVNNKSVSNEDIDLRGDIDEFFNAPAQVPVKMDMMKKAPNKVFEAEESNVEDYEIVEDEDDMSYYQQRKSEKILDPKIQVKEEESILIKIISTQILKPSKSNEFSEEKLIKINDSGVNSSKDKKQDSIEITKTKIFTDLEDESVEHKEQNEEQIQKSILQFETELSRHIVSLEEQDDQIQNLHSIQDLKEVADSIDMESYKFSIRLKVVKVLYFAVIYSRILKVKFIAGDETGISVVFTNYFSKIKPGVELELINCHLDAFKDSMQIVNDKNFKIINQDRNTIDVSLRGIALSQFIKEDLYYEVPDKNCVLIRYLAEKLATKSSINVQKMIVQVMFILNEWPAGIFCQVGDSSGRMLAYLKKESMKTINEGDVVKLMKVTAKRGVDPNKQIKEEIFYLDTYAQNAKVIPYRHSFLQISDTIMTAE